MGAGAVETAERVLGSASALPQRVDVDRAAQTFGAKGHENQRLYNDLISQLVKLYDGGNL